VDGGLTSGAWKMPITHTGCNQAIATGTYSVKLNY
jgi:hypothetical protein